MNLWIGKLSNIVLVLAILSLLVLLVLPLYFEQRIAVVLSGSMEPALPLGALAFSRVIEPEEIMVGDIIVFNLKEESEITTSHRIIEVISTDGELSFLTKGDANDKVDPLPVPAEYVRGQVVFHIPKLGRIINYTLSYVRTWPGLIFLVVMPSLLIIGGTAHNIYRSANRRQRRLDLLRERRRRWKR